MHMTKRRITTMRVPQITTEKIVKTQTQDEATEAKKKEESTTERNSEK